MDTEILKEKIGAIISSEWSGNTKLNSIMELINQTQPDYRDEIGPIQVNMMHEEYRQWAKWKKGIGSIVQESNEVVEKDWEVYEWKSENGENVWRIDDKSGTFKNINFQNPVTWSPSAFGERNNEVINAVRIKSTGKVFRLQDWIIHSNDNPDTGTNFQIDRFETDESVYYIYAYNSGTYGVRHEYWKKPVEPTEQEMEPHIQWCMIFNKQSREEAKKQVKEKWLEIQQWAKESNDAFRKCIGDITTDSKIEKKYEMAVFTTADYVEIFENSEPELILYGINCENWEHDKTTWRLRDQGFPYYKWFSTEVARDQYILMNIPMFSIVDIEKLDASKDDEDEYPNVSWEELKEAAEQKLNSKQTIK